MFLLPQCRPRAQPHCPAALRDNEPGGVLTIGHGRGRSVDASGSGACFTDRQRRASPSACVFALVSAGLPGLAGRVSERCFGAVGEVVDYFGCGSVVVDGRGLLAVISRNDDLDPASTELTERAVELARRVGDARLESAALDQPTSTQPGRGDLDSTAASVERRLELLAGRAHDVKMAWEFEAPIVYLGSGNLDTARRYAFQRAEVPFLREAAHLSVPWLLPTAALAGDFDEALKTAQRFAWPGTGRLAHDQRSRKRSRGGVGAGVDSVPRRWEVAEPEVACGVGVHVGEGGAVVLGGAPPTAPPLSSYRPVHPGGVGLTSVQRPASLAGVSPGALLAA